MMSALELSMQVQFLREEEQASAPCDSGPTAAEALTWAPEKREVACSRLQPIGRALPGGSGSLLPLRWRGLGRNHIGVHFSLPTFKLFRLCEGDVRMPPLEETLTSYLSQSKVSSLRAPVLRPADHLATHR